MMDIERQQLRYAVDMTHGHQPCIVHLFPDHCSIGNKLRPGRVDGGRVLQNRETRLECRGELIGFGCRQPQSIHGNWACGHIPKLNEDLRSRMEYFASSVQFEYDCNSYTVFGIRRIGKTAENRCIDEDGHYS
jgi:hypothetical protein